ncbi:MAG: hypothetical protein CBD54_003175 [Alphaproteobacteria bacterium TMED194]|nr:MAG: hypothetical protein CBD54_003175 [Alphaproteobacteria bacterium TMED194]|tara:strand:+ start:4751 stop:5167 length:417 start_codon:yes stop_codon:yes gene_type:complete
MRYHILKLTTGEEIVCQVTKETDTHTSVKNPLKVHTIPRFVESGIVESLALIRWVRPYTDEDTVEVKNNHILYCAKTSTGLSTFYEKQLHIAEERGGFMTGESHQKLVDSYHQSKYDDVKENLDDYIDDEDHGDKTIH